MLSGPPERERTVMKRVCSGLVALVLVSAIAACGWNQSGEVTVTPDRVTTSSDRVVVDSGDFRTEYERKGDHERTFLVFGGHLADREHARFSMTLVGLPLAKAKQLYEKHPDFHRCDSPGASEARAHTRRFDLVAADTAVLDALRDALHQHEVNVGSGGERVAVRVRGEALELAAVILKETGTNHRDKFHRVGNLEREYVLVESTERLNTRETLRDG